VAGLGALAVYLDSAVNIAFPAISADFAVPVTRIQGVVLAYILPFSVFLLGAGRLADRLGHQRVFRLGLLVSTAGYLGCGLAPSLVALLAARGLQGLGAALVFGSAPALVTLATPAESRGRALGRFNLIATSGMVLGPLLAGPLLGVLGWRVVFLGRVPLVLAAFALAMRGPSSAGPAPGSPAAAPGRVAAPDRRTLVLANLVNLLAQLSLFSIWLLVPYDLLTRRGLSGAAGGLVFAVGALAWAGLTPVGGWLADRAPRRWLAPAALGVQALGLGLTGRLGPDAGPAAVAIALALAGGGMGLFVVPNMHAVMGALPAERQGVAGALVQLMRTGGIVLGALTTTGVYAARLAAHEAAGQPAPAAQAAASGDALAVAAGIAAAAALLALVPPRPAGR
jgi:MFS family permease